MKLNLSLFKGILFSACLLFVSLGTQAQEKKPRLSPPEVATGVVQGDSVTIRYSSPSVKGRKIWGALVKYDAVWRAGANEATTVQTIKDYKINGTILPAGRYSFFIIPNAGKEWTIIFNKVTDQWGTKYQEDQDQLRTNVKIKERAKTQEMLKYEVTKNGFILKWEKIEIPVHFK